MTPLAGPSQRGPRRSLSNPIAALTRSLSGNFNKPVQCEWCKKFPWGVLTHKQNAPASSTRLRYSSFRSVSDLHTAATHCQTCRTVLNALQNDDESHSQQANQFAPTSEWHVSYEIKVAAGTAYPVPVLHIQLAFSTPDKGVYYRAKDDQGSTLSENRNASSLPLSGPGLTSTLTVSYDMLQAWNQSCRQHTGGCSESLIDSQTSRPIQLRLIDTQRKCLVVRTPRVTYAALSYVWGNDQECQAMLTKSICDDLMLDGSLGKDFMLPRSFEDAIEVAERLSYQYIFIDRLCIIQDDPDDVRHYVDCMGEIFSRTTLTIVAAAGSSSRAGISGTIRTPRQQQAARRRQHLQSPDGINMVQIHYDEFSLLDIMERALANTVWATRGWTFQEALLSSRLLIFKEDTVFWKCRSKVYRSEALPHDSIQLEHNDDERLGYEIHLEQTLRTPLERTHVVSRNYTCLVERYMARSLSFPDDVHRAFQGLIATYQEVHRPWPLHFALSVNLLPAELLWSCKCCATQYDPVHHVVRRYKETTLAETPFPTWSWLSWEGHVAWSPEIYEKSGRCSVKTWTGDIFKFKDDAGDCEVLYCDGTTGDRSLFPQVDVRLGIAMNSKKQQALIFQAQAILHPGSEDLCEVGKIGRFCYGKAICPKHAESPSEVNEQESSAGKWLHRPLITRQCRQFGVVYMGYSWTSGAGGVHLMMVVSQEVVDQQTLTFREGLFKCSEADFKQAEGSLETQMIVLV